MVKPGLGNWGLGLEVKDEGEALNFSHGGSNEGFRAYMQGFLGRGQGVVVMTNSDNGGRAVLPLIHAIAVEYGWPGPQAHPVIIKHAAVPADVLRQFEGVYADDENSRLTVSLSEDRRSLRLQGSDGPPYELIPQGGDDVMEAAGGTPGKFHRDSGGRITAFEIGGSKLVRTPPPG
jgi:hypothetical protein